MNNKGFTLIELLGTIIILALVMSIAGFSVSSIISSSKEKNYNILVSNIREAAETYYQECKYDNHSGVKCNSITNGYQVSLGNLVTYGYITGNGKMGDNDELKLVNPQNNKNIAGCIINITYDTSKEKIIITYTGTNSNCPTTEEYEEYSK